MAAINDVITMGVGTPSSISSFIAGGLQIGESELGPIISHGIGSPASVKNFITFGLSSGAAAPANPLARQISFGIGSPESVKDFITFGLDGADQQTQVAEFIQAWELAQDFGASSSIQTTAAAGNLLIGVVTIRDANTVTTPLSGWTASVGCVGDETVQVFYKIATGADAFSPSWAQANRNYAVVCEFSGVSAFDTAAENEDNVPFVSELLELSTGAATPSQPGYLAVFINACRDWYRWQESELTLGTVHHRRTSGSEFRPGILVGSYTGKTVEEVSSTWYHPGTFTGSAAYGAVLLFTANVSDVYVLNAEMLDLEFLVQDADLLYGVDFAEDPVTPPDPPVNTPGLAFGPVILRRLRIALRNRKKTLQ